MIRHCPCLPPFWPLGTSACGALLVEGTSRVPSSASGLVPCHVVSGNNGSRVTTSPFTHSSLVPSHRCCPFHSVPKSQFIVCSCLPNPPLCCIGDQTRRNPRSSSPSPRSPPPSHATALQQLAPFLAFNASAFLKSFLCPIYLRNPRCQLKPNANQCVLVFLR